MSLLELFDTVGKLVGGHTHLEEKKYGGTVAGDLISGSIIKFGALGSMLIVLVLIILSIIFVIITIKRVLNCPGFHDVVKILLVLTILFLPVPMKTLIIYIFTHVLSSCKKDTTPI